MNASFIHKQHVNPVRAYTLLWVRSHRTFLASHNRSNHTWTVEEKRRIFKSERKIDVLAISHKIRLLSCFDGLRSRFNLFNGGEQKWDNPKIRSIDAARTEMLRGAPYQAGSLEQNIKPIKILKPVSIADSIKWNAEFNGRDTCRMQRLSYVDSHVEGLGSVRATHGV